MKPKTAQPLMVEPPRNTELNLKQVLMEMGNRLVTEHRFLPGPQPFETVIDDCGDGDGPKLQLYTDFERRTSVITLFTEFVNSHPEAQQVLKELGFAWPVVQRSVHDSHK